MAKATLPPAVCPYCGLEIELPLVSTIDRHSQVRVVVNDVEWHLHLLVEHPDKVRIPPAWEKKR